jgi:hypothetical protein
MARPIPDIAVKTVLVSLISPEPIIEVIVLSGG